MALLYHQGELYPNPHTCFFLTNFNQCTNDFWKGLIIKNAESANNGAVFDNVHYGADTFARPKVYK